ncbi:hypothetical protein [Streptomyces avidinii]
MAAVATALGTAVAVSPSATAAEGEAQPPGMQGETSLLTNPFQVLQQDGPKVLYPAFGGVGTLELRRNFVDELAAHGVVTSPVGITAEDPEHPYAFTQPVGTRWNHTDLGRRAFHYFGGLRWDQAGTGRSVSFDEYWYVLHPSQMTAKVSADGHPLGREMRIAEWSLTDVLAKVSIIPSPGGITFHRVALHATKESADLLNHQFGTDVREGDVLADLTVKWVWVPVE